MKGFCTLCGQKAPLAVLTWQRWRFFSIRAAPVRKRWVFDYEGPLDSRSASDSDADRLPYGRGSVKRR
jgi:hypothetical protein